MFADEETPVEAPAQDTPERAPGDAVAKEPSKE